MVRFGEYFETMVSQKPEWRRAYVDYPTLKDLLKKVKKGVKLAGMAPNSIAASHTSQPDNEEEDENVYEISGTRQSKGPTSLQRQPEHQPPADDASMRTMYHSTRSLRDVAAALRSPSGSNGTTPILKASRDEGNSSQRLLSSDQIDLGRRSPEYGAASTTPRAKAETPPPRTEAELCQTIIHEAEKPIVVEEGALLTFCDVPDVGDGTKLPTNYAPPSNGSFVVKSMQDQTLQDGPHISDEAVDAAEQFESLLVLEVAKATQFAQASDDTYRTYFTSHKSTVKTENPKRVKDNLRYLHGEVCHLVQFIETNCLAIKTALKKYRNSHPFFVREEICEAVILPPLQKAEEETLVLKKSIEAFWADHFSEGKINEARQSISGKPASPGQSFRAGFFLALIVGCFLYWLHVWFELLPDYDVSAHFSRMYPVMRLFMALIFSFVCWSGVLWVCHRWAINYLYVFEFSQLSSITWMKCLEYGLSMFFLCSLACCLYVRSELQSMHYEEGLSGFRQASPWIFPSFIMVFVFSIVVPYHHVFRRTRNCFFHVFWCVCKLPFGYVRFVDFFVADWGTSFPYSLGDLLYTVCYYTAVPKEAYLNDPTDGTCHRVRHDYWFPVAMIPYYWRACQTLKMYFRTKNRAHLVNHGKYLSMSLAFITQWWFALDPSYTAHVIVWIVHIGSQIYAYVWDVLMDWGWIKLSKRRCIINRMWPYYSAMVFDLIARLYFVPLYIYVTPIIGMPNTLTIQTMVEIFRRALWSIFRIENENINNLETYRSIDFVPKVVIPN